MCQRTNRKPAMTDRDPNIVNSSLSGLVTTDGVTVDVQVYRLEHDPKWALEVINSEGTSTTWDSSLQAVRPQ